VKRLLSPYAGFTIIELSLVLLVLGILAVALVPLAQTIHQGNMNERDEESLETARDALLGYIRINEGIPCVDAAGNQITPDYTVAPPVVCDSAATLGLLGVRTRDSRGRIFAFDVNDTLTENEIAVSGNPLCTALANIINPAVPPAVAPEPDVWAENKANTGNTAGAAANEMALVLVGRGSDRCLNLENTHASVANDAACQAAVAANRTFENPARNHSLTTDDGYYEDLVYTVTPAELANLMACPPGGGGGGPTFTACGAGETLAQVSNGDNSAVSIEMNGACYVISAGTTASMGCQLDGTALTVHSNQACSSNLFTDDIGDLDTNNDGRADIVCDNNNACNWR